jgi:hypothetical protein
LTTGNRTLGPIHSTIRIAPLILTTLLTISFLAGVLAISALTTLRPTQPATAAGATFDAVKFRAEERAVIQPSATFDAVKFRAEERTLQP